LELLPWAYEEHRRRLAEVLDRPSDAFGAPQGVVPPSVAAAALAVEELASWAVLAPPFAAPLAGVAENVVGRALESLRGKAAALAAGREAAELTSSGNSFRIRHSETTQEVLTSLDQVDYLFTRMFAFVRVILKGTGRGG
jgi:hypothetical protein